MAKMNIWMKAWLSLGLVGAINWALVGVFDLNIVSALLKNAMAQLGAYLAIGASGAHLLYRLWTQ